MPNWTLYCGNYMDTLANVKADLILTSPPYNIGSKCPKRLTNRKNGGYDAKSWGSIEDYPDSLPEDQYQEQQRQCLTWCAQHLKPNGSVLYNHKPRHKNGQLIHPFCWFPLDALNLREEIVWDRGSTHNHCASYLYDQSERFYQFCLPGGRPYFRNQKPCWTLAKAQGLGNVIRHPRASANGHNAPFPLALVRQFIRMYCPPQGTVCDIYAGSGTTMLAACLEGRSFVGSEILPKYHKQALERFGACNKKAG